VRAAGDRDRLELGGAHGEPAERRHDAVAHQRERRTDLHLLDVLGEIARRHSLVDLLVPRQVGELVDARLDVVLGDPVTGRDRLEVDLFDDRLVGRDDLGGHGDARSVLGFEHGDPQLAFEDHLLGRRPDAAHRLAGVARAEHVGDREVVTHSRDSDSC
jgi:hypothetical protein